MFARVVAGLTVIFSCAWLTAAEQQFYELRVYRNTDADKQAAVVEYLAAALVPALNRFGSDTIGVFTPAATDDNSAAADVYVLIPYASPDQMIRLSDVLAADQVYQNAAEPFLAAPASDPAYTRMESRFMKAFSGMPVLQLPSKASSDRILELRIYESSDEQKARLKVEMFNEGEIGIMQDVQLAPVFFGETLISDDLPNLTYMLSADNPDVHRQHFQDFLKHPKWDVMKRLEKYKGTVSKIRSVMLVPAACSQI